MDCNNETCTNLSQNEITCVACRIPKYCSETCKQSDFDQHSHWCKPRLYSLKDFIPAKASNSIKVLNIGTNGEVQLVQHISSKKVYTLKVIRKTLVSNTIPLKVLMREIMIHKTLVHPNIVRLIDHFEDLAKLYLLLEYVEEMSLFDLIRKNIKLSEKEACDILVQVCTGLNYLHQNNIIHRDLKPENLLVSSNGCVKICNFAWSAQGNEKRVTFCGTLDYTICLQKWLKLSLILIN